MRIAVLADIHGNLPAFEAALADVECRRVDRVFLAGDVVVGSPDSVACWELARSLDCPMLRGNHERYIAHYGTSEAEEIWSADQFAPVHWAHAGFTDEDRRLMAALPGSIKVAPGFLLVHASARSDVDSVFAHTPDEEVARMFPGSSGLIVRAHNHVGQVRSLNGGLLVTCGSVGLPLDGHTTAQYLLLERRGGDWSFEHRSVPYDVDAALRRFRETGYLEETGPVGRLFMREVATASHQIVPFLRLYSRWSEEESISLEGALDRFLNGF